MALHTTLSDRLKNVTSGRRVKFTAEPYVWTDDNGVATTLYWTLTRTAEMSYNYLSLTRAAAEAGAQSLVEKYTRKYEKWSVELDESTTPPTPIILETTSLECKSGIVPVQSAGDAWEIDVDVNDVDTVIVTEEPETYEDMVRLFALAGHRDDADDGKATLAVVEAHWDSVNGQIVAFYEFANIESFDPSLVTVQRKQGDNWINVPLAQGAAGVGGVTFQSDQNLGFRVSYNSGAVVSNYVVTADAPLPGLSMADGKWNKSLQSADGSVGITIAFSASGVPRALANIKNANAWRVRVVGGTTGTDYSAAFRGSYELAGINRPREVVDLGGGLYSMTYFIPSLISPSDFSLSVTIAYGSNDGPSSSATATFWYSDFFDIQGTTLLDVSPAQTRVRIAFISDAEPDVVHRAAISVVGSYAKVGFGGLIMSSGTVEKIVDAQDEDNYHRYVLVVRFTTLQYRLASYELAISGTISDAESGYSASFATTPLQTRELVIAMPSIYITSVVPGSSEGSSVVSGKRIHSNIGDAPISAVRINRYGPTGLPYSTEWVYVAPTSSSGEGVDFQRTFDSADLRSNYLAISEGSDGAIYGTGRFIGENAVFTRIISAAYADGVLEVMFDEQHPDFDVWLLEVYDKSTSTTYSISDVDGDVVRFEIPADGSGHRFHLIYNGQEVSNAVSVQLKSTPEQED